MNSEGGDSIMNEEQIIRRDRMRFKNNKTSANLTLLAILLDVLYFVNIYQNDADTYYYQYMIGISIIYNLVFMLAAFLSEEGVKNYKKNYSIPLVILGVIQIIRIFILPMDAHNTILDSGVLAMGDGQFTYLVILLIASAICLLIAAVVNIIKCRALASHMKMLAEQDAGRVSPSKVST